jgi:hypothetical protein
MDLIKLWWNCTFEIYLFPSKVKEYISWMWVSLKVLCLKNMSEGILIHSNSEKLYQYSIFNIIDELVHSIELLEFSSSHRIGLWWKYLLYQRCHQGGWIVMYFIKNANFLIPAHHLAGLCWIIFLSTYFNQTMEVKWFYFKLSISL